MITVKDLGNGTGRLAGPVGSKSTTIRLPVLAKNNIRKIKISKRQVYVSEEVKVLVRKMLLLDDPEHKHKLKKYIEELHTSDLLSRNRSYEFIAANRVRKNLPEGWTAKVTGQHDSTAPDIVVLNQNGELQYCIEVKMPESQASPVSLKKDENGKWQAPPNASPTVKKRVKVLNHKRNLESYAGSMAEMPKRLKRVFAKSYQEELMNRGVKEVYFATLVEDDDLIIPVRKLYKSKEVDFILNTPRPKASGSRKLSHKDFDVAKDKAIESFGENIDIEFDPTSKRTFLYLKDLLDSKTDSKRRLAERIFIGGSSVNKIQRPDGQEFYKYELRATAHAVAPTDNWVTLLRIVRKHKKS